MSACTYAGRRLARDHQQPARVPIDAMYQFERFIGPRGAQCLDDAEAHAAAAVHGDAGRLVDHQQPGIFMDGSHQSGPACGAA